MKQPGIDFEEAQEAIHEDYGPKQSNDTSAKEHDGKDLWWLAAILIACCVGIAVITLFL
jgi:hypothetical protein